MLIADMGKRVHAPTFVLVPNTRFKLGWRSFESNTYLAGNSMWRTPCLRHVSCTSKFS